MAEIWNTTDTLSFNKNDWPNSDRLNINNIGAVVTSLAFYQFAIHFSNKLPHVNNNSFTRIGKTLGLDLILTPLIPFAISKIFDNQFLNNYTECDWYNQYVEENGLTTIPLKAFEEELIFRLPLAIITILNSPKWLQIGANLISASLFGSMHADNDCIKIADICSIAGGGLLYGDLIQSQIRQHISRNKYHPLRAGLLGIISTTACHTLWNAEMSFL